MTVEEQALLEKVKYHSFEAESALTELVRIRNVPKPRLKKAGDADQEEDEWKGLLQHFIKLDAGKGGKNSNIAEVAVSA